MSPAVTISCRLPRSHESENAPRFFSIVLETPVYPRISPTYNLFVFKILPWLLAVLFFHLVFEAWGFSFKCLVSPPTLHFSAQPLSATGFFHLLCLRVGAAFIILGQLT